MIQLLLAEAKQFQINISIKVHYFVKPDTLTTVNQSVAEPEKVSPESLLPPPT